MKYLLMLLTFSTLLLGCSSHAPNDFERVDRVELDKDDVVDMTDMCLDINNKPVLHKGEVGLVIDDYFYCNDNLKLEKRDCNTLH